MATAVALDSVCPPARPAGFWLPHALVHLQSDEGAALVGAQWRYWMPASSEIDFVEVGGRGSARPGGANRTYDVAPARARPSTSTTRAGAGSRPRRRMRRSRGTVCFNWYRARRDPPRAHRGPRPDRRHRGFRGRGRRLRGGLGRRRAPHALGDTAARSSPASTRPTASLLDARRPPGQRFRSRSSGSTARSRRRRPTTSGCARRRSTCTRRARVGPPRPRLRVERRPTSRRPRRRQRELERVAGGFEFTEGPSGRRRTARCCSARRTRTRSTGSTRSWARSLSSARRAATPASTSVATSSPARTG